MLKAIFTLALALYTSICIAASIDVNQASSSELQAIKGIGAVMAEKILSARKTNDFINWEDLSIRVKGIGPKTSSKLSRQGLTVNGKPFKDAKPAPQTPSK